MSKLDLFAAASLALAAATAHAQTSVPPNGPTQPSRELPQDRGYDKPSARADAVNAREAPVTQELNAGSAGNTAIDALQQGQYEADRQAYMVALAKHDASIIATDERYARQQIAYADAMRAWRLQAAACEKGKRAACEAPTPNPADFW